MHDDAFAAVFLHLVALQVIGAAISALFVLASAAGLDDQRGRAERQARFALSTRQLKDYSSIPQTRRTIARILTVQRERSERARTA